MDHAELLIAISYVVVRFLGTTRNDTYQITYSMLQQNKWTIYKYTSNELVVAGT